MSHHRVLLPTTYQGIYPSSYHEILIPLHCIAYQGSLSHCIFHLRDFTPTDLHIMRSKSHCITYQGISIPLHIMGSQPHCIAYHCISHPRVFTPSHHEIFIPVRISNIFINCITALIKPNQHFIISMIHLGLPRPLQVSFLLGLTRPLQVSLLLGLTRPLQVSLLLGLTRPLQVSLLLGLTRPLQVSLLLGLTRPLQVSLF